MLFSTENEKNEVDNAGPMARAIETVVWESPFVVPSERRLGAAALMKIKITPGEGGDIKLWVIKEMKGEVYVTHTEC